MRLVMLLLLLAGSTTPRPQGPYDPPGGNPGGGGGGGGQFDPSKAKTFTVDAFQFDYTVRPAPFEVTQGDSVRIILTALDSGQGSGHGFFLETYYESEGFVSPGSPRTIEFVAHTIGTFRFFCTNVCGIGHGTMDGVFTVRAANAPTSPAITSITPSSGTTAGGTGVTVKGERFASGTTLRIGAQSAQNVTFVDATTLTATTPAGPFDIGANSARDVVVTNVDGQSATLANGFTWSLPAPAISNVSPVTSTTGGGARVTIRGAGFTSGLPVSVRFGGVAATNVTVVDAVTLTAIAPPRVPGVVDVMVTVGAASTTASNSFTYVEAGPKRRSVRRR